MSLAEIKEAINGLSHQERCELNAWLNNYEYDDWDRQIQKDIAAGKFDKMAREGDAAYERGECRPFP